MENTKKKPAEKNHRLNKIKNPAKPTLPHNCSCSTISDIELNYSVRNGKRCGLYVKSPGTILMHNIAITAIKN